MYCSLSYTWESITLVLILLNSSETGANHSRVRGDDIVYVQPIKVEFSSSIFEAGSTQRWLWVSSTLKVHRKLRTWMCMGVRWINRHNREANARLTISNGRWQAPHVVLSLKWRWFTPRYALSFYGYIVTYILGWSQQSLSWWMRVTPAVWRNCDTSTYRADCDVDTSDVSLVWHLSRSTVELSVPPAGDWHLPHTCLWFCNDGTSAPFSAGK